MQSGRTIRNVGVEGIRKADVACLVKIDQTSPQAAVHVLSSVDRTLVTAFRPSGRLVRQAILLEQQSVVHVWNSQQQQIYLFRLKEEQKLIQSHYDMIDNSYVKNHSLTSFKVLGTKGYYETIKIESQSCSYEFHVFI